jgi:hypothetical protein
MLGAKQKLFLSGRVPSPLPNGFYKGSVGMKTSWQGKKFDAKLQKGINIINGREVYPFRTYVGKGLRDKDLDVLKIDYNIPKNPFWLRFILDEIVQTSPNHFLGKVHIKLLPGVHFTLGFFRLEK